MAERESSTTKTSRLVASTSRYEAAHKKRMKMAAILIFTVMPLVILASVLTGGKRYMLVSVIILALTMLPFFMVFENRKPKAREIVLIATMSALTVISHVFLHMTIPIQIGTALVIISGISLGPEAGFLIGSISRFVCNFYLGQGPWTPWQMFCWGLLGFLAGLAFNKVDFDTLKSRNFKIIMGPILMMIFAILLGYIIFLIKPGEDTSFFGWRLYSSGLVGLIAGVLVQKKRLPVDSITMTVFTFFTIFVVYGGIMNVCALITSYGIEGAVDMSISGLKTLYISAVPYDSFHAGSAALCVFLFGENIIRKLERIKIKYGIYK